MTLEESRKFGIFRKGLTHGFGQNFNIFFQFAFLKKRPKYTVCLSSREKTTPSRL